MATSEQNPHKQRPALSILLRGMLMGLAEVVPGVSGGTMAFITGIYYELVASLASFGPRSIALLLKPVEFAKVHNLRFLSLLGLGMLVGVLIFAQLMNYLLQHFQPVVWGFFSGVIAMSVFLIGHQRAPSTMWRFGSLGFVLGVALLWLPMSQAEPQLFVIFIGGAIAVCAWLLPAVSGSYMLLALGLYAPVIAAVADVNVVVIVTLLSGCAVGLLLFSKSLAWLLENYQEPLLALLTGFMLGSIANLWPWQQAAVSAPEKWLLPATYAQTQAGASFLVLTLMAFVMGGAALWLLHRVTNDT